MNVGNEPDTGRTISKSTRSLCGHIVIEYVSDTRYACVSCGEPVEKDKTYLDIAYDRCLKSQ